MYRIGFEWRQENPSGNSIQLRARAGQYGEIKRMVVDAPSERPQPTGVNRLNACFPVLTCVVRLQGINVLARDCCSTGVQAAPKLSVKTITRNVEKLSLRHDAMHGKPTVRQADGGATLRCRKKQMPSCSGADRA